MEQYIFPKFDIPKVPRTKVDLSTKRSTTFAPGVLVPIYSQYVLPNDTFVIKSSAGLESFPMLQPTQGRWKLSFDYFFCPDSNIIGYYDNNTRLGTEDILKRDLPNYSIGVEGTFTNSFEESSVLSIDTDNPPVSAGSVWQYFGWPAGWRGYMLSSGSKNITVKYEDSYSNTETAIINTATVPEEYLVEREYLSALKPFHYLDIVRNYYVNNQEKFAYYMANTKSFEEFSRSGVRDSVITAVALEDLDDVFTLLRSNPRFSAQTVKLSANLEPDQLGSGRYDTVIDFLDDWQNSYKDELSGLFLRPYRMDFNRALLNVDNAEFKAVIDTSGPVVSVETLRYQNRMQSVIDIFDVGSGRVADWLRLIWNVNIKGKIDKPVYLGSRSVVVRSADIISTAITENGELGQQAGFAVGNLGKGKPISFTSDQYGVVFCIASLVPDVSYSQGFNPLDLKTRFLDIYMPQFANIGYQDVPMKELFALPFYQSYSVQAMPFSVLNGEIVESNDSVPQDWTIAPSNFRRFPSGVQHYNDVVGKRLAWSEYMTDVDYSYGLFSEGQNLESWKLNRTYIRSSEDVTNIADVKVSDYNQPVLNRKFDGLYINLVKSKDVFSGSTYVDPRSFNDLFADVRSNAQNFRLTCDFRVVCKRAMPKRRPPHI